MALVGAVFVLMQLAAPLAFSAMVNARYRGGSKYLGWLTFAYCCNGLYFLMGNYFLYAKRTYVLGCLTTGCAVVNIALNVMLVPKLGAMGAAIVAGVSWALFFVTTWVVASRLFPMPWRQVASGVLRKVA